MWSKNFSWLLIFMTIIGLVAGMMNIIETVRSKREVDIFQTGAALAIDKALEVQQALEHGVKFQQNVDREVDFFGAKFETGNNHKVGYGDSLKDSEKNRRKRSEQDDMNYPKGEFGESGNPDDNVFVRMWKSMVQAAKGIAKKVTDEFKSWNQNQTDPRVGQSENY